MALERGALAALIFLLYLALWHRKRKAVMRLTGRDPEVIYRDTRPSQRFLVTQLRRLTVLLVLLILMLTLGLKTGPGLKPLFSLPLSFSLPLGAVLSGLGLGCCHWAQHTMGAAWRVGLDATQDRLITHGAFAVCRNPTYLGLFLVVLGVVILFPVGLMILWAVVFFLLVEMQVRLEEEGLMKQHGPAWQAYCKKVNRYFPFPPRKT